MRMSLFSLAAVRKFVPVTVTAVPRTPIVGEKLVMVGVWPETTENALVLVAFPAGDVMEIGPVVAPDGTVTTNWLVVADTTVAAMPLKATAFWLAVAEKP